MRKVTLNENYTVIAKAIEALNDAKAYLKVHTDKDIETVLENTLKDKGYCQFVNQVLNMDDFEASNNGCGNTEIMFQFWAVILDTDGERKVIFGYAYIDTYTGDMTSAHPMTTYAKSN